LSTTTWRSQDRLQGIKARAIDSSSPASAAAQGANWIFERITVT